MNAILQFTVTVVINFMLKIIPLNPRTDIGDKWTLSDKVYGPADNDGITAFQEVIVRASLLVNESEHLKDKGKKEEAEKKKKEAYNLLFADGLAEGQNAITGDARLVALATRNLADPDLGWSLYKEEGQKTLRYLYDTFGVEWMEFLRRVLCYPDGDRRSLCLFRGADGSWRWRHDWLCLGSNARDPALVLGE